jgi:hypothetical protein
LSILAITEQLAKTSDFACEILDGRKDLVGGMAKSRIVCQKQSANGKNALADLRDQCKRSYLSTELEL